MNGRQIEIFHAIMKAGTVTEAAKSLGITQPAVTASLKQIETMLGFNLFHRSGGRLQPTAEARILNNEASRIQDSLSVFKKLALRLQKDLTSHLRIASLPAFSHELVPTAIASFTNRPDNCFIDVSTQHHNDILLDISNSVGHSNLGFTFGLDERVGLGSQQVGKAEIVALVPADWSLAQEKTLPVAALKDRPLIGTFPGEPLGNRLERLMHNIDMSVEYVIRVHNHSLAANLVSRGVGATIIDSVTAHYAKRHFQLAPFAIIPLEKAPPLPLTAVYSYEHPLNKHARAFIEFFRQSYTQSIRQA